MRKNFLFAALALSGVLAFAPVPSVAGNHGWHAGGGYWSLPAGARFALSSRGVGFGAGGFHGHHGDHGFFVGGRPRQHGRPGGRGRGPVLISPPFGQPVVVVRDGSRFLGSSTFAVRRFDRVSRTVVVVPAGGETSLVVKDWVPVPRFRPWPQSRSYLRFSWD